MSSPKRRADRHVVCLRVASFALVTDISAGVKSVTWSDGNNSANAGLAAGALLRPAARPSSVRRAAALTRVVAVVLGSVGAGCCSPSSMMMRIRG